MDAFMDAEMIGELSKVQSMNKLYLRDPQKEGYVMSYHMNYTHNLLYLSDVKHLKDTNWHRETRSLNNVRTGGKDEREVNFSSRMSPRKMTFRGLSIHIESLQEKKSNSLSVKL